MKSFPQSVRMTEEERIKIKEKADAYGEPLGVYMKRCALKSRMPRENCFTKEVKPLIRTMQTSLNMMEQNIDVERQKKKILKEVKELCLLLN